MTPEWRLLLAVFFGKGSRYERSISGMYAAPQYAPKLTVAQMATREIAELRESFGFAIVNQQAYDAAVEWIKDHLEPQDVFDEDKLAAWAMMRGWTKPEE